MYFTATTPSSSLSGIEFLHFVQVRLIKIKNDGYFYIFLMYILRNNYESIIIQIYELRNYNNKKLKQLFLFHRLMRRGHNH